jgi:Flp pilus assembly protein TadD
MTMRTKKQLFRNIGLSLAASLIFGTGAGAVTPDMATAQKKGVVAVHVSDRAGRHLASVTGIVIDRRGVVATSCFIIPKWLEAIENTLSMKTGDGAVSPIEYLVSRNCNNGIALIKMKGTAFPEMRLSSDYGVKRGETVTLVTAAETETTIAEIHMKNTGRDGNLQVTVPAPLKRDGSPVLNAGGEVVGISSFVPGKKQNRPTVVPVKNVLKEFSKYRHLIKEAPSSDFASTPSATVAPQVVPTPPLRKEVKTLDAQRYFSLGKSYEKTGTTQEALEAYKEAIRIKPDFFDAYVSLGLLYYRIGRYDESADAYLNAVALRPDDKSIYNKLGATYIILGNYSMALDTFRQSLKIDSKNPETHFNLGIASVMAGDRNSAVAEYVILKDLDEEKATKLLDMIY